MYVYTVLFFQNSFTDEHLGCFHRLVIVNNTAMNIVKQIPVQIPAFKSFVYVPRMLAFFATTEH